MTTYLLWTPPLTTPEDIDMAWATLQPHMRTLASEAARCELQHDAAIALGLRDVHTVFHLKLDLLEDLIDRGIRAQWS